jgi:hypothetical protein
MRDHHSRRAGGFHRFASLGSLRVGVRIGQVHAIALVIELINPCGIPQAVVVVARVSAAIAL